MTDRRDPIVQTLLEKLEIVDGALGFTEAGRGSIALALESRLGRPDLRSAVVELVLFAFFLEQKKGAPEAAQQLIDLVQLARPSLEAQGVLLEKIVGSAEVEGRIKSMLDQDRDLTPVGNKPAVEGAMKWWNLRGGDKPK